MTDTRQRLFISYAGPDRAWAEWAGWQLERAGHQVEVDRWDWQTGDDFIQRMDRALKNADAVVALFSNSYFAPERWTQIEWTSAVAAKYRLVPVSVAPLTVDDIPTILSARLRKDLHGLDETGAVAALLEAVDGPSRPTGPVAFPGGPGAPEAASGPEAVSGPEPAGQRPRLPSSAGQPDVWNVRRRNPTFSGREAQLVQLRDGLLNGQQSRVHALHGMGGVGKSQIALEYAHRFASQYDIVWWIDAEQADQFPVHYTELADRLGIAKPDAGTEHNARALLHDLRSRQRWLLIFDNAEHPDQIDPWLPDGPGHVLITSRNPNWGDIAHQTALDVFTRPDSLTYLRARIPSIADEQADVLAKDLGDLPLALAQAAGVIGNGMTLDRYRRLLTSSTARILREGEAPGYPASLAAATDIATTRLDDNHPDATALLRLGAFLGPEPIPTAWLEAARPRLTTIPGDPDDLMWPHASLQHLGRYGLARIDHETFQIHRLTQAVLRDQTSPDQAALIRADATAILAAVAPGDPETPETWPAWASLTSHLTAQHIGITDRPELRPILLKAVLFLIRSGQSRAAHGLADSLRQAWSAELGHDHPDVLSCAQYFGHAMIDLGDSGNARPVIEETLARRRATLGDDHPDTLQSANDLAVTLNTFGEHAEARRMDEDTLARRRRTLGDDHLHTLQSASNLAAVLHSLGEYVESRRMDEDTLARNRRTLGSDHPHTLHSAHSLAITLNELGEHTESRRMDEDTLARRRRTVGNDHPDTLRSAHSLAITLHSLHEYAESRRIHQDTLTRRRRTLGDDHPDTLRSAHSLAITLHSLGEHAEARHTEVDTLARRRRTLGNDHRDTLHTAHSLAITLHELGEHNEARRLDEDTLARRRRTLGDDHHDTLDSELSLAITLHVLRAYPEAVHLLEDVRARRRRLLGDNHPDTVRVTRSLANTLTAMGKRFEAQKLLAPKKQNKRRFGRKRR
ncbi:FxSxx-COOH system tetratricopeptide repeat protein [Streptomyces sp. AK02-01A]|uniref:FxSxx-COOH system tetratricopeptide repeat protein n=1 Tax=Streptomyces sp. AK02-01A TaxID=3028648 RepID=UPI0029A49232|nr:FxSxx-COOH system tetratricopeptide repeat protein [Streptomyces sp. AK02-01A]MDX3850287.1 FxSxx-COOH system tetratricopeptide repeat protein [Streptomyces sp. AK02-01A]